MSTQIVEIVLESARAQPGAARVAAVHVGIGALTGIAAEPLRFCFEAAAAGSLAAGARLLIERRPAVAACRACGWTGAVEPPLEATCPHCGAATLAVSGGRDLTVERIELELASPHA